MGGTFVQPALARPIAGVTCPSVATPANDDVRSLNFRARQGKKWACGISSHVKEVEKASDRGEKWPNLKVCPG